MRPTSSFVGPMLTDLYELTMAYGYWKNGKHEDGAVFDLFFRKNPFSGEFTIFAGLEEVIRSLHSFRFSETDIKYLRSGVVREKEQLQLLFEAALREGSIRQAADGFEKLRLDSQGIEIWDPIEYPKEDVRVKGPMENCESAFFEWLKGIDCSELKVYALPEGTIAFPRVPLIRVEGPLALAQMQETLFLNLTNFASLMATNAARFRLAAGPDKGLIEFGLRRAQGPDGGVSASRYAYMGGFNGTSNVKAGQLFGIPVKGTMAHSYVSSFLRLDDARDRILAGPDGNKHEFLDMVLEYRSELGYGRTNEGELAAFVSYAQAFPNGFLALVDTYDSMQLGVPNFVCVALALIRVGYKPVGIRLDSGDLAYLSKEARRLFREIGKRFSLDWFAGISILASNDIEEATLLSLRHEGHEIDAFGIGTHLVTCKAQPALGCVYKLVAINGLPRIKLSDQPDKMTIPGRKDVYRLVGEHQYPVLDLMTETGGPAPAIGEKILCRHPINETKRAYVTPTDVIPLHRCVWDGRQTYTFPTLEEIRDYVLRQISMMRPDHLRTVNPTPYKVSVSEDLYRAVHELWMREAPVAEIG